jgi:hypothetical protein
MLVCGAGLFARRHHHGRHQKARAASPSAALESLTPPRAATDAQEPPEARRALQALLAGRLVFTPRERDGRLVYEFEGPGTVSPVVTTWRSDPYGVS